MARSFSGSGQYLSRSNPTGIVVNAAWTWIGNIYMNALATNHVLLLVGTPGATRTRGFRLYVEEDDRLHYEGDTGDFGTISGAATWHTVSVSHSGSGTGTIVIGFDGTQILSATEETIVELSTGDAITFGHDGSGDYHADWTGRIAWSAWVQGTAISVANAATYAADPCSLLTDYGPSGTVTANALKGLWPFQPGSPGQDISGVGNDLTDTSTSDVADPGGYPTSCGSSVTLEQEGFRWFNDDGDEDASTAAASQDTSITATAGETRRLRMLLNATGDPATTQFKLQYRKVGDTPWNDIT